MTRESRRRQLAGAVALALLCVSPARAQSVTPATRTDTIAAAQTEKAKDLQPHVGNTGERIVNALEEALISGPMKWHPFFESALAGGGFTLGAGYRKHVSSYNSVDLRGSFTVKGYTRLEAEFLAPRLFDRRGVLSVTGGWREATQVGFYGIGTSGTSVDDRTDYGFEQAYASAVLSYRPTRGWLVLGAGVEASQWTQGPGSGAAPSVEEAYSPSTLPGLGSSPTYVHWSGSVGADWRPAADYARLGGYYGVAVHNFADTDEGFGFTQVDYTAIQHIPILRDVWVLSLRGDVQTTQLKEGQTIPFYMLPALGGGSSLRGFASWRFRDRHSVLLSADWRVLANHFLDVAVFYDAGKVVSAASELNLEGLKTDFGVGFRMHGPMSTPLRIDVAKSDEGLQLVFSAKAAF